jgi:hypothetical protein
MSSRALCCLSSLPRSPMCAAHRRPLLSEEGKGFNLRVFVKEQTFPTASFALARARERQHSRAGNTGSKRGAEDQGGGVRRTYKRRRLKSGRCSLDKCFLLSREKDRREWPRGARCPSLAWRPTRQKKWMHPVAAMHPTAHPATERGRSSRT